MAKKDKTTPFEFLQTRAFSLFRKWMDHGDLTESETHELVEIQKVMPAESFKSELRLIRWLVSILGGLGISLLTIILVHLLSNT
ncbi:MAG: hypothetical protein OXF06_08290 [Bacteroidetes bacterium]|nr:hypothetical protein [Bacteroidota bacterium]